MYLMVPNCRITPYNKGAFVAANLPRISKACVLVKVSLINQTFYF